MRDFDIFRNTDDMTVEMIAASYPVLSDEEKERMFAMSERKFNIKERKYPQGYTNEADEEYDDEDEVDGVEEYDRPMWLKFLTTAAALMLVGGGLAVGRDLLRRRPAPDNVPPPNIATAVSTGTQTTSVTGADNITYTIDVDAMLTGLETAPAVPAETTTTAAAPAAPAATQAPAAPAPTEAATEAPTSVIDDEEYQKIVKDLLQNEMYLWGITRDMDNNYYDLNEDNVIKTQYIESNTGVTYECEYIEMIYIEMIHPIFKSVDDMWAMARNTYTDIYASEYFGNVFQALEIYPGKIQTEADSTPYGIYEGKLYCRYFPGYQKDPLVYDHYEAPTEKAVITVASDNAFQAAIPVHAIRKNGKEVVFMEEMLVVRENGKWLIDGFYSWRGENMTYEDYQMMIGG